MNLNFSNEIYREKAKHSRGYGLIKCGKRASEAFMQLIKDGPPTSALAAVSPQSIWSFGAVSTN